MHKVCCYLMLLGGLVLLVGCGQSGDSMVKEQIDTMNELADGIEADSAEEDIKAINERLDALAEKIKELPEEKRKELIEKHKKELAAAAAKLAKAKMDKMGEAMEGVMKDMQEGMKEGMPKMPKMPVE
ncbi:unnamed protein product [marine sediment metagenome]|uniref:Uncharacterized protein n=1 Tax=marine sediment metagenome TaxID=412755 RepID=X0ZLJ2_9ZZZZ